MTSQNLSTNQFAENLSSPQNVNLTQANFSDITDKSATTNQQNSSKPPQEVPEITIYMSDILQSQEYLQIKKSLQQSYAEV